MLDVNPTVFYAWKNAPRTVFEEQAAELLPLIRVILKKHRRRCGARRILKQLGYLCSRSKDSNIMKMLHLKAIPPQSCVPKATDSRHRLGYSPNLLLEADEPTQRHLGRYRHRKHSPTQSMLLQAANEKDRRSCHTPDSRARNQWERGKTQQCQSKRLRTLRPTDSQRSELSQSRTIHPFRTPSMHSRPARRKPAAFP